MSSKPFIPWIRIAYLGALSVLPALIVVPLGVEQPTGLIGFTAGFLACLYAGWRWALIAIATAVAAHLLSTAAMHADIPGGLYGVGSVLALATILATPKGGLSALAFAAFGWVFLVFSTTSDQDRHILTLLAFAASGGWGVVAARWLSVGGMMAPGVRDRRMPSLWLAVVTSLGFLATLYLAESLTLSRPYWVPFVYLSIIATTGLTQARAILRRMIGASLGALLVFGLAGLNLPFEVEIALAMTGFAMSLRITIAYPVISRALLTASIVLMLFASEPGALGSRLLAEFAATGMLLVIAGGISLVAHRVQSAPQARDP
ncbi:MAG: FUSC family protein [Pseudomonadota bacterium]